MRWIMFPLILLFALVLGPRLYGQDPDEKICPRCGYVSKQDVNCPHDGSTLLRRRQVESFDFREDAEAQYSETRRNVAAIIFLVIGAGIFMVVYKQGWLPGFGSSFLCDSCKFNSSRYCSKPERPNATSCGDYKALSV